jgi:hypothetical protein
MTASMTAADLVAGILQKTGGMPVRALIGHHRLISLAVLLLKGSRVGPRPQRRRHIGRRRIGQYKRVLQRRPAI